ncbi:hypothetical protein HU200_050715 [Digitaria exilis]|uniref:Phosphatidylinositol 4-phosphate 5-kinase n=1 Tax=Digitaria exilis TaxID=1010633 RepID=A0A835AWP1_9POAL|nr:hypothetical protein HU200_050715 [Digitaria exilis]
MSAADDSETASSSASSSSSAGGDDGDGYVERGLPNGDFYTGQWRGGAPHGAGKYLWTDGCMYEGEWRHGKATGRGKFSWPSGATYEGEFKDGFMDGSGTYTGAAGDTYRGSWSMNLKHGNGTKSYANGDQYDGEWRSGLQDGSGRYTWRNGTEYTGQWRGGLIHGRGALVWSNGNRYDGGWEDGCPRDQGTFRWADGSVYVGYWTRDSPTGIVQQKGVYYPSPAASSPTARDPRDVFARDLPAFMGTSSNSASPRKARTSSVNRAANGRASSVSGLSNSSGGDRKYDKICIWESDGDITCDIVDGVRTDDGSDDRGLPPLSPAPHITQWVPPPEPKRQGETISKGHKHYELMLNLQLGIRHAVGKQGPIVLDLKSSAFDPKEKVWTKFPPEGSKYTPPHNSCDFRWKDYCPQVFRTLRKLFKVDAADYMLSLCGNEALRELSSPGKSGSFFYLTNDDRYMIKTMKKSEVKMLLKMLPAYYNHVRAFENTLVTKFFGLHCVKLAGANQKKVRFVIMGNLFCSEYPIHRRFDLKGSSLGRTTDKPQTEIDQYTTLKDLDLNFIFRLKKQWFQEFQSRQVDRDCEFLEQEKIMDYSLLVGVHFRDNREKLLAEGTIDYDINSILSPHLSRGNTDQLLADTNRLGANMPSRAELTTRKSDCELQLIGEPTGEYYDVILYFGIIDILQDYDISKKLEHAYKSFQYDSTSISAVDPRQYSRRFRDFIYKAFQEDG